MIAFMPCSRTPKYTCRPPSAPGSSTPASGTAVPVLPVRSAPPPTRPGTTSTIASSTSLQACARRGTVARGPRRDLRLPADGARTGDARVVVVDQTRVALAEHRERVRATRRRAARPGCRPPGSRRARRRARRSARRAAGRAAASPPGCRPRRRGCRAPSRCRSTWATASRCATAAPRGWAGRPRPSAVRRPVSSASRSLATSPSSITCHPYARKRSARVVGERELGGTVDRDVVVVVDRDQPAEPEVTGQRRGLVAHALGEASVARDHVACDGRSARRRTARGGWPRRSRSRPRSRCPARAARS